MSGGDPGFYGTPEPASRCHRGVQTELDVDYVTASHQDRHVGRIHGMDRRLLADIGRAPDLDARTRGLPHTGTAPVASRLLVDGSWRRDRPVHLHCAARAVACAGGAAL